MVSASSGTESAPVGWLANQGTRVDCGQNAGYVGCHVQQAPLWFMKQRTTHGTGYFSHDDLARLGSGTVLEDGVRIWHPETVEIGDGVYVGHGTMLKGYPDS